MARVGAAVSALMDDAWFELAHDVRLWSLQH